MKEKTYDDAQRAQGKEARKKAPENGQALVLRL